MSKRLLVARAVVVVSLLACAQSALAAPITYTVAGTVSQTASLAPTVGLGDLFTFTMTFDPLGVIDSMPSDPNIGQYVFTDASWTATVDGHTATGSALRADITNSVGAFSDVVQFAAPSTVAGYAGGIPGVKTLGVSFSSFGPHTEIGSDAFLLPAFGDFPFQTFSMSIGPDFDTYEAIQGTVTSITVGPASAPTPVPEPTSATLLGLGIVAAGLCRARSRRTAVSS